MEGIVLALRVLLSLAAVLALLWLVQRRLARRGGGRGDNPLTVLGRQAVGQKASVVVVEMENRRFLLGVTEGGISLIHSDVAPQQPLAAPTEADFAALLASAETAPEGEGGVDAPLAPTSRRERRALAASERGPLAGSILSPETWRQTAQVLRRTR